MRLASDSYWGVATVWSEARGEPQAGRIAVGEVIRNRAKKHAWSIARTVLAPQAFSCWNTYDVNRLGAAILDDTDPVVIACTSAWMESEFSNLTGGALNYWNPQQAKPSWADSIENPIAIGNHLFGTAP